MTDHMGKLVYETMLKRGITPPQLAGRLGIHKQGISKLWRRKEFHTKLLKKLSAILEYDFFQELAKVDMKKLEELEKENDTLKKEMSQLKRENELLVQANNWLSKPR